MARTRSTKPSYSKPRGENILAVIAELKFRKKLRNQDIADALNMPLSTFMERKRDPGQFRMWEIWIIMQLAETAEEKKAGLL